jgi:hypothetical protein
MTCRVDLKVCGRQEAATPSPFACLAIVGLRSSRREAKRWMALVGLAIAGPRHACACAGRSIRSPQPGPHFEIALRAGDVSDQAAQADFYREDCGSAMSLPSSSRS